MHKHFQIKGLKRVSIIGVGLLGGSIGLALRAAGFTGTRVGIGRRASSLKKALACGAVDEVTQDLSAGCNGAQLVVICTPISQLPHIFGLLADALDMEAYVTDVASAKAEVVRLAHRSLPKKVQFVGSHPMAGSEKTGVEFSRADLFDRALCLVTPTPKTSRTTTQWVRTFWQTLGARTLLLTPERHDELLARISHLPHAVAAALVGVSRWQSAIDFAGPGFADTTRIASGEPAMWTDIFRANRRATIKAVDQLIDELSRFRGHLKNDDVDQLMKWLASSKKTRDQWVAQRYKKQVLPP